MLKVQKSQAYLITNKSNKMNKDPELRPGVRAAWQEASDIIAAAHTFHNMTGYSYDNDDFIIIPTDLLLRMTA